MNPRRSGDAILLTGMGLPRKMLDYRAQLEMIRDHIYRESWVDNMSAIYDVLSFVTLVEAGQLTDPTRDIMRMPR